MERGRLALPSVLLLVALPCGSSSADVSLTDVSMVDVSAQVRSQLYAGQQHTCAVLSYGVARCWGEGDYGKLGRGTTDDIGDDETPASAGDADVGGMVVQLAIGGEHTCALLQGGVVRCFGYGEFGQLGYGNTNDIGDDEAPFKAGDVPVGGTVVQLAAGYLHTCALLEGGAVRCWGSGLFGQLGYGNINDIGDNEAPFKAGNVDVGAEVVQLTAGDLHTCALLVEGNVRCWGSNFVGQLGYGHTNDIGDDEAVFKADNVDIGGKVVQLVSGHRHNCALLEDGAVRCWGDGKQGNLGYGNEDNVGDDEAVFKAGNVDVGVGVVRQLTAGEYHTCALLDSGAIRCWGNGQYGQLGYGNLDNIGDDETPASAGDVDVGGVAVSVAAGSVHTCAMLEGGAIRCWGWGQYGQLGYGNTDDIGDDETPATAGDVPYL